MLIYVLWFMNKDDTVLKISWNIYILMSKSIIVKQFRWFLMIQLPSRCMLFEGYMCVICVLFIKGIRYCDVGMVLIGYYHSNIYQSIGYCIWCNPKSYNRSYVHFCVPWILEEFSNDPDAGTTNDFNCCLH